MSDLMLPPPDQRRRLLVFNLRTDADDHILGFATRWINALAQHYRHVDVLTMHRGRLAVAENVRVFSAGRERGYSKMRRTVEFYRLLLGLLRQNRYDACFAHMMPLFAALGGPFLQMRGVPITTWYTHRQRTRQLIWATRFSYRVVSAVESSYPLQTPKLRPLGHGIDTDFYAPQARHEKPEVPCVVYVARLTQIKHQHILLQAAAHLDCRVVLVGDVPDGYDDTYKHTLQALAQSLGLAERVTFAGAQTPQQVRDWLQRATVALNLSPPGLFDKAPLEAMAMGLPVIVSNPAFTPLLGQYDSRLRIAAPDAVVALRAALQAQFESSPAERAAIGHHLRTGVVAQHSLTQLVRRLICVMHAGDLG